MRQRLVVIAALMIFALAGCAEDTRMNQMLAAKISAGNVKVEEISKVVLKKSPNFHVYGFGYLDDTIISSDDIDARSRLLKFFSNLQPESGIHDPRITNRKPDNYFNVYFFVKSRDEYCSFAVAEYQSNEKGTSFDVSYDLEGGVFRGVTSKHFEKGLIDMDQ